MTIQMLSLLLFVMGSSFAYAQNTLSSDVANFHNGETKKYVTKGHVKANGINMQIRYPNEWINQESDYPHVVQNFMKRNPDVPAIMLSILIRPFPDWINSLQEADLASEVLKQTKEGKMLPKGTILKSLRLTKYDGQPGILMIYQLTAQRAGGTIVSIIMTHRVFYRNCFIDNSLTYGYLSGSKDALSEEEYKAFIELGISIGNSIVLLDKYQ